MLTKFYGVSATMAPVYLIAFAAGNLAGPLVLGRLYGTIGRKPMIAGTYLASGAMLVISGYLFSLGAAGPARRAGPSRAAPGANATREIRCLADVAGGRPHSQMNANSAAVPAWSNVVPMVRRCTGGCAWANVESSWRQGAPLIRIMYRAGAGSMPPLPRAGR